MVGLTVLYLRGGGGVGVMRIAALSLRGSAAGVIGLAVLCLRGGAGVGVVKFALSLPGGGVRVMGVSMLRRRGGGVGVTGLTVLYLRGGGVGVVMSARCGRGAGVKLAPLFLRSERGVVFGLAIASSRDRSSL